MSQSSVAHELIKDLGIDVHGDHGQTQWGPLEGGPEEASICKDINQAEFELSVIQARA